MSRKYYRDVLYYCATIMLLFSSFNGLCTANGPITYAINEELDIGSFIGNLRLDTPSFGVQSNSDATFVFYDDNEHNKLFRLEPTTGKLYVGQRIDRESICEKSTPSEQTIINSSNIMYPCQSITLEVLVGRESFINVIVEIKDINDNSPIFPNSNDGSAYTVSISESVRIGHSITLEEAIDPDIGINTIQNYTLAGSDFNSFVFYTNYTPPYPLSLVVAKPLDAEEKQTYFGELKACDGGFPKPLCSSKKINVRIIDVNDNQPVFEKLNYNKTILESTSPESVILQVKATDADVGKNGQIRYEFGQAKDWQAQRQFSIRPDTGEIVLKSPLNARKYSKFELLVIANDGSSSGHAKVLLEVIDVNNNKPWIKITSNEIISNYFSTFGRASLAFSENRPANSSVGLFIAGDEDLGENAEVSCKLVEGTQYFELNSSSTQPNQKKQVYMLMTKTEFDRESISTGKIEIKVQCVDRGKPPLITEELIDINIIDVNEFRPVFNPGFDEYVVEIPEDTSPGTVIFQAQAQDLDATAELHYELSNEAQAYFNIGTQSGRVTLLNYLDREKNEEIRFNIYATDGLFSIDVPATAVVKILDINDNKPQLQNFNEFEIYENEPAYSNSVGRISAFDPDLGENGTIRFKLISVNAGSKIVSNKTFAVNSESGEIRVLESLDREFVENYILKVELRDMGEPSMFNIVNMKIHVKDRNDHRPEWRPISSNAPLSRHTLLKVSETIKSFARKPLHENTDLKEMGIINISAPLSPGLRLFRLNAHDSDASENANITFELAGLRTLDKDFILHYEIQEDESNAEMQLHFLKQFFALNIFNGDVTVSSGPDDSGIKHSGLFEFVFNVSDNGMPPRTNQARIFLLIQPGPDFIEGSALWNYLFNTNSNLSFNLIVIMVTLTCLISLCMLIAIIIVKKRSSKDRVSDRVRRRRILQQQHNIPVVNPAGMEISPTDKWMREDGYIAAPYGPPLPFAQYIGSPTPTMNHDMLDNCITGLDTLYYSMNSPLMPGQEAKYVQFGGNPISIGGNNDSLIRKPHSPTNTQVSQLGSFQSWSNNGSS